MRTHRHDGRTRRKRHSTQTARRCAGHIWGILRRNRILGLAPAGLAFFSFTPQRRSLRALCRSVGGQAGTTRTPNLHVHHAHASMLTCAPTHEVRFPYGCHRRNLVQAQTNRRSAFMRRPRRTQSWATGSHKYCPCSSPAQGRGAQLNRRHVTFGVQTWHDGCPPISLPVPILMAR